MKVPVPEQPTSPQGFVRPAAYLIRVPADEPFAFFETWYAAQCDGDWDHEYGVTLETLDNPGWSLNIDLIGTALEGRLLARNETERTETDWLHVWSDGERFRAAGGARNLRAMLSAFRDFARSPSA
jgi:hypothetical protein